MRVIKRNPYKGYIDNWLWVPKAYVDVEGTKRALTYEMPDPYSETPTMLYLWQEATYHLLLPRAFWSVPTLPFPVVDCRPRYYEHIQFESKVKLDMLPSLVDGNLQLMPTGRDVQTKSFNAMMEAMGGVLQLSCGKGKTVIALHHLACSQVPALILLDNTNLLEQWAGDIEQFLEVPGGVGRIVSGKKDWRKALVLATYQSVANWAESIPEEARRWFGNIYWDEGHHVSAPTYAKSAPMFYGNRFSLTATPERADGFHIISDLHIGSVVYKDLSPEMKPRVTFYWTGLTLNLKDPGVAAQVLDVNNEVHISKLTSFFGQWQDRLQLILNMCWYANQAGRKLLVLCNSVDEVVNLMALCTLPPGSMLYTDIPVPTSQEVGETLTPKELTPTELEGLQKNKLLLEAQIEKANGASLIRAQADLAIVDQMLQQHAVHKKVEALLLKRQKQYIRDLVVAGNNSVAGFLTYGVSAQKRQEYLDTKPISFAITKYGKEGMDCPTLDTVILSSLFSSKSGLQQLMGRPTRPRPGKKEPLLVLLVDNIGQCIGMAKKLQAHLRSWPRDEGGPYEFTLMEYPAQWNKSTTPAQALLTLFGPSSTVDPCASSPR